MYTEDGDERRFSWSDLGDIEQGRPNLGDTTSVALYRLLQYTMRDVLRNRFDPQIAEEIFFESGRRAGLEFCSMMLDRSLDFQPFVAQLQATLEKHGVGILRLEETDFENRTITLAMYEDLDCSGQPDTGEMVCSYDEGFFAGVLEGYTGESFQVKEVDCWAAGGRVCRFKAQPLPV